MRDYSSFVTKEIQPTSLTGSASFVTVAMLSPNTLPELSAAYASDCSNDSFGRSLVPVGGRRVSALSHKGNAAGSQDQMLGTHGECPGVDPVLEIEERTLCASASTFFL